MERKLNNKNYIAIADWMVTDFDFNTRELLCYAIIYGFSQDGESVFSGSLNYLSTWLGIRRDNVLRYLNGLVEKGVVTKEKKSSASKSWCEYRVVENKGAARNSDHIIISPWMINDLGLKDKELILYALIHGFSRSGSNSVFSGNNNYMAKWLKIDKQHVTRYTSSLIKKELIERIEKDNVITYKAIVPKKENDDPNHFEYTLTNDEEGANQNEYRGNQFENIPNQAEEISLTNLSTNNIFLNNLNNNLENNILNNNNVVDGINKTISSNKLTQEEKELLEIKKLNDKKLLKKYSKAKFDVSKILESIADYRFRLSLAFKNLDGYPKKAEELLLKTLNLRRYFEKVEEINNLAKDQVLDLFSEACNLYDEESSIEKFIRKSPEAYFIGIVDNVLNN